MLIYPLSIIIIGLSFFRVASSGCPAGVCAHDSVFGSLDGLVLGRFTMTSRSAFFSCLFRSSMWMRCSNGHRAVIPCCLFIYWQWQTLMKPCIPSVHAGIIMPAINHALAPRLLTIDTVSAMLKSIEALEKKKHRHMLIPGYPYYYTLLVYKHLQDCTGPRFRSRFAVGIFVSCLDGDGWDGGVAWYVCIYYMARHLPTVVGT